MKSKVKFDLTISDESVICAQIVYTDDIRDKVAMKFLSDLGYDSNLAMVRILPNGQVSLSDDSSAPMATTHNLEIKALTGDPSVTLEWLKQLSKFQLEIMQKNIPAALKYKASSPKVEGSYLRNS